MENNTMLLELDNVNAGKLINLLLDKLLAVEAIMKYQDEELDRAKDKIHELECELSKREERF